MTVFLEPGEAVALNAGYLVSRVLALWKTAERRSPFWMPVLPVICRCAGNAVSAAAFTKPVWKTKRGPLRLAGPTCLAGDVFGD